MEENKQFLPQESVEPLEKISNFRLQMLLAQVKTDFTEGLPRRDGSRKEPSVRSNNRILFSALETITKGSVKGSKPTDEYEQRATKTLIECFNCVMLKIALDEAKKRKDEENVGNEQQNGE